MFDPNDEPFIDHDIGKMLVTDPELDKLVRVRLCQKSVDFHVQRIPGRIVWRTFDYECSDYEHWRGVDVDLLGIGQLARCHFSRMTVLEPGDRLIITYTLNWWYNGGGGSDLPSRGLFIRPKTLVPPLWRVPDLCFSTAC